MENKLIQQKAADLRERAGGTIFGFPIHEEDPRSPYAVVVYSGGMYHVYPEAADISLAALGVKTILDKMIEHGYDVNFEKDVRLVSYEAQMNAPDVRMRRLKKENLSKPLLEREVDYLIRNEEEGALINARGLLKWTYIEMVDERNPKAIQFMGEYYKILAGQRYGKTAAAIKQEVRRMTKDEGIKWIERTYARYVKDDSTIMDIMQRLV
ncbi:hypothetical protein [Paenibacillus zanthoxyli]|uniref:hypothetical protein n=1 Tax=Paenibacillus zanthoxyli TaxID=369399 RepID=UPI00046F8406|nr:hypothetical protein [Paenibacillus zanthoxyli]